jgi:A/G-specific adenine glycosylase
VKALRGALLRWYDANHRDLPWRRRSDAYAIWLSEAMLQQTRVETVIPYYQRFLSRFPDVQALADADSEMVYEMWAGLGYYSRARNLHATAKVVAHEMEGEFPGDAEELRRLPGIGRYTAGAIASIAFDRPEPLVDGNVARVFARLFGVREDIAGKAVVERLWETAADLAEGPRPGDLNQALMELGATICTPRGPRCMACPVARACDARAQGDAESLPVKTRKKPPRPMRSAAAWIERRGKVLAVRRPEGGLLGGLWELPGGELIGDEDAERGLKKRVEEQVGLRIHGLERSGEVEHVFTHRLMRLAIFRCDTSDGRVRAKGLDGHRWIAPVGFERLAQGAPTRKALALLAADS